MQHTINILANLNCGDLIVRSTFGGVERMTLLTLDTHRKAGAVIVDGRARERLSATQRVALYPKWALSV